MSHRRSDKTRPLASGSAFASLPFWHRRLFAVSLLDYLFGEKVALELPDRTRHVTRRWLDDMDARGLMKEVPGPNSSFGVDSQSKQPRSRGKRHRKSRYKDAPRTSLPQAPPSIKSPMQAATTTTDCGDRQEILLKRAAALVPSASIFAITVMKSFQQRFPITQRFGMPEWELFVASSSVFVAMTALNAEGLPRQCVEKLEDIVSSALHTWRGDSPAAFDNCRTFYDKTFDQLRQSDQRFASADAIGAWIAFHLLDHQQTTEELGFARPLGMMVVYEFNRWWRGVV